MVFLSFLLGLLVSPPGPVTASTGATDSPAPTRAASSYCEDFAKRQVSLADRLLQNANYSRAVKVLNSTAQNCDRSFVREKLYETLTDWYGALDESNPGRIQEFRSILSNQSYITSDQRSQLQQLMRSDVRALLQETFEAGDQESAYDLCRTFSDYTENHFESEYYCGTSAEALGADATAVASYAWLLDNWDQSQSLVNWMELADTLQSLYLRTGRFRASFDLTRRMAARNASPDLLLSSLLAARSHFLEPILEVGAAFYRSEPGDAALSHVDTEMQRVDFPQYVRSFYLLAADGSVERGMYGSGADAPGAAQLAQASGVSLIRDEDGSDVAWLVHPIDDQHLILELGTGTTPEENVRLESVQANVESDEQWDQLYQLEYTETYPASGSALGTFLGGAHLSDADFDVYEAVFDASPTLAYYGIQNGSAVVEEAFNFQQSRLGYGEDEWERTSSTPALYHHSIEYGDQAMREVVWPNFVDDEWDGVVRIGLVQS
jgi:hypothetical protein